MPKLRLLAAILILLGFVVPHAPVAEAEETELSVRIATPVFEITAEGVTVPGYAMNDTPGAPRLPVYGTVVELPPNGDWELDFVSTSEILSQRLNIPAVSVPQRSTRDASDTLADFDGTAMPAVELVHRPDPAIYGANAFYPATSVVAGSEQSQRGKRLLALRVFPFQYNPVTQELQYHSDLTAIVRVRPAPAKVMAAATATTLDDAGPLAGELGALRIRTSERGMHRLTYDDLSPRIPLASADPASFQITYLGQPVRINVTGAEDGKFDQGDLVVFYAEPYTGRWMTTNVYRFSYGDQAADPATRMSSRQVVPTGAEPVVTTITQTLRINQDKGYFSDYWIDTEADHFFDTVLTANQTEKVVTRTYDLALDDAITTGEVRLHGLLYGVNESGKSPYHWARMLLNGHEVGVYQWTGREPHAITPVNQPAAWLDGVTNQLHLEADISKVPAGIAAYKYNPDFVEISYPALADVESNSADSDRIDILGFPSGTSTSAEVRVTGFFADAVKAYDVRDPRNPVQILSVTATNTGGSYQVSAWDAWSTNDLPPAYWLSSDLALLPPAAIEVDQPTTWRTPDHEADYIVITHTSLWDAIQPLIDHRAGYRIAKVNVQDVYDEFNYGHLHQEAIRKFLSYAYQNWNAGGSPPKYVLLVGDGTVDFKGVTSTTLKNLIPPFLLNIDPWIIETAADNRFVSFDGPADYLPEMIISRLPAQTPTDVANFIDKIVKYEDTVITPDGDWQDRVTYVADDKYNSAGDFHVLSDNVRTQWLPSYYSSPTVYYGSGTALDSDTEMKAAIKKAFNDSPIYLQWFGHASRFRWGSISFWNILDTPTLNANTMLPFVAAYSCWDGYFHNIDSNFQSLAEKHLLQQGRGSIGNLSPSGQHVGDALLVLDQGLTKTLFQDRVRTMGDTVDQAKLYFFANSSGWHDVLDTSILFGDPALQLRLPLPPPVAPDIDIAHGPAMTIDLDWLHLEPDTSYEVWRGTTPYFDPDSEGVQVGGVDAQANGYVVDDPVVFNETGAEPQPSITVVGDVDNNYFWIARGSNWRGDSDDSNRVGEFDFALVKGQ